MLPTNDRGVNPSGKYRGFSLAAPHLTAVQSPIKGIEATLDAFSLILEFTSLTELQKLVDDLFSIYQDKVVWYPDSPRYAGKQWQGYANSPTGMFITFDLPTQDAPGKCRIEWKGNTIRRAPLQATLWLITRLKREHNARFTRVDLAMDDYDKSIDHMNVLRALLDKNYKGWKKKFIHSDLETDEQGFTYDLGTKNADSYVRFYNKSVESKGEFDCYRFERQCKDKYADEVVNALIYANENSNGNEETFENYIAKTICALSLGNARFVEVKRDERGRVTNKNMDREKPLEWWKAFTDKIGEGIRIRKKSIKRTLQQTEEWHNKSVAVSVAKLVLVHGQEYLDNLLKLGMEKLNNPNNPSHRYHMAQIEVALKELGLSPA